MPNNYPKEFNEQNKKDFDELREIAKSIDGFVSLIYDGDRDIMIELAADTVDPSLWGVVRPFNAQAKSLSASFALLGEDKPGERYV